MTTKWWSKPTLQDEIESLIALYGFERVKMALHHFALNHAKGRSAMGDAEGLEVWLKRAADVDVVGH